MASVKRLIEKRHDQEQCWRLLGSRKPEASAHLVCVERLARLLWKTSVEGKSASISGMDAFVAGCSLSFAMLTRARAPTKYASPLYSYAEACEYGDGPIQVASEDVAVEVVPHVIAEGAEAFQAEVAALEKCVEQREAAVDGSSQTGARPPAP